MLHWHGSRLKLVHRKPALQNNPATRDVVLTEDSGWRCRKQVGKSLLDFLFGQPFLAHFLGFHQRTWVSARLRLLVSSFLSSPYRYSMALVSRSGSRPRRARNSFSLQVGFEVVFEHFGQCCNGWTDLLVFQIHPFNRLHQNLKRGRGETGRAATSSSCFMACSIRMFKADSSIRKSPISLVTERLTSSCFSNSSASTNFSLLRRSSSSCSFCFYPASGFLVLEVLWER